MKSFSGGGSALSSSIFSTGPSTYNPATQSTMVSFKSVGSGAGSVPSASSETVTNNASVVYHDVHSQFSISGSARVAFEELITGVSFDASDSKGMPKRSTDNARVRFSGGGPSANVVSRLESISECDDDGTSNEGISGKGDGKPTQQQQQQRTVFSFSDPHIECIGSSSDGDGKITIADVDSQEDNKDAASVANAGVHLSDDGAFIFSTGN
jgi:hypothetical protein